MTPDEIIKHRIAIREELARMNERFAEECKPLKEAADVLDQAAMAYLNTNNLDNAKTAEGMMYKASYTQMKMADRRAFAAFIIDGLATCDGYDEAHEWLAYFTAALSKEPVEEYIAKNNAPPPGIDVARGFNVRFRSPTEK